MILDPAALDRRSLNALVNGLVAPRPIAWVSTVARDGSRNLATFSFFNVFSYQPPTVGIGFVRRGEVEKDSLRNIRATGQFVVSFVSEELARVANATSADFPPGVDEWEVTGLKSAISDVVAAPRVAASPAALECRVRQIIPLGPRSRPTASLVLGEAARIYAADDLLDGIVPRPAVARLVGRLGEDLWCTTRERFSLARPASTDPAELHS